MQITATCTTLSFQLCEYKPTNRLAFPWWLKLALIRLAAIIAFVSLLRQLFEVPVFISNTWWPDTTYHIEGANPRGPTWGPRTQVPLRSTEKGPSQSNDSSVSWLKSPSGWLESLPGWLLRQTFGVQMAWPSGRGPKGPFGFYRSQVIVTLCSQVPWRSIGGTQPL